MKEVQTLSLDVKVGDERTLFDGYTAVVSEVNGRVCTVTFKGTNIVKTIPAETFKYGIFDAYKPFKAGQSFSDIHLGERRYQDPGEICGEGEEGTVVYCDDEKKVVYVSFEKLGKTLYAPYDVFYSRRMFKYSNCGIMDGLGFSVGDLSSHAGETKEEAKKREEKRKRDLRKAQKKVEEENKRLAKLKENSDSVMLYWFTEHAALECDFWLYTPKEGAKTQVARWIGGHEMSMPDSISGSVSSLRYADAEDKKEINRFLNAREVYVSSGKSPRNFIKQMVGNKYAYIQCMYNSRLFVDKENVIAPSQEEIDEAKRSGDLSNLHVFVKVNQDGLLYNLTDGCFWLNGSPFREDKKLGGYTHVDYPRFVFRNLEFAADIGDYDDIMPFPYEGYYDLCMDYEVRYKNGKLINKGHISSMKELISLRSVK